MLHTQCLMQYLGLVQGKCACWLASKEARKQAIRSRPSQHAQCSEIAISGTMSFLQDLALALRGVRSGLHTARGGHLGDLTAGPCVAELALGELEPACMQRIRVNGRVDGSKTRYQSGQSGSLDVDGACARLCAGRSLHDDDDAAGAADAHAVAAGVAPYRRGILASLAWLR